MPQTPQSPPELPAIGFLEQMSDEDRKLLSSYGEFIDATEGSELIKEGEPQGQLYLLLSGLLHVSRERNGTRTLLWRAAPGEAIGEVNVFDPGEGSADVTAHEDSRVWRVGREDLETFVDSHPASGAALMLGISRMLSKRLRAMNERFAMLQRAMADHAGWK
ncbi:Crp/Fnr family transcriptional regulator [Sulfuriroseicoccus oceanibius]|uniref:Crp/Fnr family transcriptional regulator n=1 Tax=Sulfuriroseicoccus oceanibius TaxID=2707525 RepID=A0A6B3L6T3_9BACT|nr:Crp/Fnr family transcriptional regulator [Sulfuriroseicoccus oceanibius]QQL44892.1 Crp/Fnr family transcriptional regulator [Sulfuriroseicoccus oceanibius]